MKRTFEVLYQNVMDIISNKKRSTTESENEMPKDTTNHGIAQEYMCPCCLEILFHPMILVPCGHTFCRSCLVSASDNGAVGNCGGTSGWSPDTTAVQCYSCRADITSMIPNRTLESAIQALISSPSVAVFSSSDIETYNERSSKSCENAGCNVIVSGNDSDRTSRRGRRRIVRARRPFHPPPPASTFGEIISPVWNRAAAAVTTDTERNGVDREEIQFNLQEGISRVRQALERMHQIFEERGRVQAERDNESAVMPVIGEAAAASLLDDVMQQLHEENEQIYDNYDREEANLLPVVREMAARNTPSQMSPSRQEDLFQRLYAQRDRINYYYDDDITNSMPFPDDLMVSLPSSLTDNVEVVEPPQQVRSTTTSRRRRGRGRHSSRRSQRLATRPRRQQT